MIEVRRQVNFENLKTKYAKEIAEISKTKVVDLGVAAEMFLQDALDGKYTAEAKADAEGIFEFIPENPYL